MTNKQLLDLEDVLYGLEKAEKFIKHVNIDIVYKGNVLNKQVGSDLNYLYSAKERLVNFIENNK